MSRDGGGACRQRSRHGAWSGRAGSPDEAVSVDREHIVRFLRDELGGFGNDPALVERLGRSGTVTVREPGVTTASTRALASGAPGGAVHIVLEGLLVLRSDGDVEPPVALATGGMYVLGERASVTTALRTTTISIDEATWRSATGDEEASFETWRDALGASYPAEPVARDRPPDGRDAGGDDVTRGTLDTSGALLRSTVERLMCPDPIVAPPERSIREAAALMGERRLSCLPVVRDGALVGIVTESDMTARVVGTGASVDAPLESVMTPDPFSIGATDSAFDLLSLMARHHVSHVPVIRGDRVVGIVTHGDLVRRQSISPVFIVQRVARLDDVDALVRATADVPRLLADLVESGGDARSVGRLVTSVTDALTRRLIELAVARLGPAPCRFAWLACGSQGRREQSGATDQDNALLLEDAYEPEAQGPWFEALAAFVCDGLAAAGYDRCPGEMMASTDRWRQPLAVWQRKFGHWIAEPGTESQLLASVMFDLRCVAGERELFSPLRRGVFEEASRNSLFVAHMGKNSLGHRPPIGLFNRLARARRGAFRGRIDLKLGGIAPIVDLGRLHALAAALPVAGTVERLRHACEKGSSMLSTAGARDLLDVWETVSMIRLEHQARQVRRGEVPDNHVDPGALSRLERERLRDALLAVRDIQSALGNRLAAVAR